MKNKKLCVIALSVFFVVSLIILAACKKDTQVKPTPGNTVEPPKVVETKPSEEEETLLDYFPLKVGNTWTYEGEGMEYAAYTQSVKYEKGNKYQVMVNNGGTVTASVFEVNEDSIRTIYKESEVYDDRNVLGMKSNVDITVLKIPLQKGTNWVSEENKYEIVKSDAKVKVPAGEFENCLVVKVLFKDNASSMLFYFKKGIGLVLSEFKADNGDVISSRLKRFDIKKTP